MRPRQVWKKAPRSELRKVVEMDILSMSHNKTPRVAF